ncbi:hypothetical protein [Nonomuraea sp. SBT364]|nr:hypothetical protein [Nonomuraea sp. SBT364]
MTASYDWWVLDERQLTAELARHGLEPVRTGPAELGRYLVGSGDA